MQLRDGYSATTDVLACRCEMLGLDLNALENCDSKTFKNIEERCVRCELRTACDLDLRRDPNDPVWETYCPIAPRLVELTQAWPIQ